MIGCLVRVLIGTHVTKLGVQLPTYRLCIVEEVVKYRRDYKLGLRTTDKALMIRHGQSARVFTMDKISNQDTTNSERERFVVEMDKAGQSVVTKKECLDARGKRAALDLRTNAFTSEQVDKMVEQKNRGVSHVANITLARMAAGNRLEGLSEDLSVLQAAAPAADADDEAVERYNTKVAALEVKKERAEEDMQSLHRKEQERRDLRPDSTFTLSAINKRNEIANEQSLFIQARRMAAKAKSKKAVKPAFDPFRRANTKPKVRQM